MFRVSAIALLSCVSAFAAVRGDEAMYVGGTLQVPEKTEGRLDVTKDSTASFLSKKGAFDIPYAKIESMEYGQKVGRRVGAAVVVSPVLLLSKKRKHYLTMGFQDSAGAKQSAVFELSKGSLHPIIVALEKNSGKKVEFESEEAKKHYESSKENHRSPVGVDALRGGRAGRCPGRRCPIRGGNHFQHSWRHGREVGHIRPQGHKILFQQGNFRGSVSGNHIRGIWPEGGPANRRRDRHFSLPPSIKKAAALSHDWV